MAKANTMRKVSLRNVFAHKLRLALTVIAVVLGTSFISGAFMFTNSLSDTFDSAVQNAFTDVDVAVTPADGEEHVKKEDRAKLEKDDKVAAVNVIDNKTVVVAREDASPLQTGGGTSSLGLWYSPEDSVAKPNELVEGAAPKGEKEAVVNASAAEQHGIKVGDKLLVVEPDERYTMKATGIYEPAMEEAATGVRLYMDAKAYLGGNGGVAKQVVVKGADGVEPQALVDHLNKEYPKNFTAETGEKLAEEMSDAISSALKFVNYFLVAFGLIALLVGTFIIANTFSMIVAQRTKEFALLRALGASRRQITNSVVVEAIIIGVLGSILGVFAGVGLVAAIKAVMEKQGMPLGDSLGLSVSAVVVPIVLGTLVTVASAWAPAQRAGAVEPVEAMRSTESAAGSSLKVRSILGFLVLAVGVAAAVFGAWVMSDASTATRAILVGVGAFGLIVGFFLAGPALSLPIVPVFGRLIGAPFGAVGKLAATNSQRNPRRTSATAFALTLGLALVTAIGMLGASMKTSVADVMEDKVRADYILSGPTTGGFPTPSETPKLAREVEGVDKVLAMTMAPAAVDGKASVAYQMSMSFGVDENPADFINMEVVEGDVNLKDNPGFIATDEFAKKNGWVVGKEYDLTSAAAAMAEQKGAKLADAKTEKVKLIGTFKRNEVIENMAVSQEKLDKIVSPGQTRTQLVGVNLAEGADPEQVRPTLEEAVKDLVVVQIMSAEEFSDQAAQAVNQMLAILYGLLALAVIIAILGIVNTLTLGVIERRQEIGMLRAVGTQRRQIRTMITLEAVQISVFGAVMGMLIGLGLGWAFLEVLSSQGLDTITVPWGQLAIMLAASGVVGVIAAIWPGARAAKTPPLEAIAD